VSFLQLLGLEAQWLWIT